MEAKLEAFKSLVVPSHFEIFIPDTAPQLREDELN